MSQLKTLPKFIENFLGKVNDVEIDVSTYNLDHVAYQASSSEDYEDVVKDIASAGNIAHEAQCTNTIRQQHHYRPRNN